MSWGLGWKRASEIFHLSLDYGGDTGESSNSAPSSPPRSPKSQDLGFRIDLDWSGYDDDDQVALRLQSQLMVALPPPQDTVLIDLEEEEEGNEVRVRVWMRVMKRREPLKVLRLTKSVVGSGQSDGVGVLNRLVTSSVIPAEHWNSVTVLSLSHCGLSVLPAELIQLPLLERLYLDNNKLSQLPTELGEVKSLKVLNVDSNMLVSLPVELKQCVILVELSLEHNRLVRPLLDFRAMSELRILRLFGNPLEFLPEILPLQNLRHLSLANIRIEATENLKSVNVQIEMDNSSYFIASRHKLSTFFSLIFRFSSCHHPLLASALAKIMQDRVNHLAIGREENAIRQLISMITSDNLHVVEQACCALSSLAADVTLAMLLIKADIMQPIQSGLKSVEEEELISVLQVVVTLAFASDTVAQKMLTKEIFKSLKVLCAHKNAEVQRLALFAVGNLAFCLENRRTLTQSKSLRELLLRLTLSTEQRVNKAAARALAILGENENLRRAVKGRPVGKGGLRILSMDGGGMKGLATVKILRQIEQGTGKRIHELFDLICGTSTGGMLAIALTVKQMTLDQCEEIYKTLGKLVFAEPIPKDEAATWKEKLDQLFKSSSQSFRVVVHGSKHSADQFERLLKEMCADDDGDLLIESAVKSIPKVFVVSTLVSSIPAQPFIFRNYQYPIGTPEISPVNAESPAIKLTGETSTSYQVGVWRKAFIGSCKHRVWEAIRASSAAPYYLDDYSDDVNRWQDGAIVANNPTVFAIREAQLLWPDTPVDCLVSIGCGSVPTKARKGGWRYLDTGQVLIESACSVERVEEALDTLIPALPHMQYYRFNPVDERCGMELDETDPSLWLKLEAATEEYIQNNSEAFKNVCERLHSKHQNEDKHFQHLKIHHMSKSKSLPPSGLAIDENSLSLGWRSMILLVECSYSPADGKTVNHARSLETFCALKGFKLYHTTRNPSLIDRSPSLSKRTPEFSKLTITVPPASTSSSFTGSFQSPFTSPLFTGSFPSSPRIYTPSTSHIDLIPPLSLDSNQMGGISLLAPASPPLLRQPSTHVRSIHEKLQKLPQVGIIHLALQNDSTGSILSWQNDVFVVAEPGEHADKFLQSVKQSLLSMMQAHKWKDVSSLTKVSSVSDLVKQWPRFQVGGILHRYIGCQTQVMDDNQELGAYMFRRKVPAVHLTSEDVRWMVGAWRGRVIICTGRCGPHPSLLKAFFDSGAKAVIASKVAPPNTQSLAFPGSGENNENGKFVIADEETTDEELDPASPISDWEDNDAEKGIDHTMDWNDDDEEELTRFVCLLYEKLLGEGARLDVALHHTLKSHPKLSYTCHLPHVL